MSEFEIPDHLPQWITDHIKLYLEDPEKAHMWDTSMAGGSGTLPTLLLITTGKKSGKKRPNNRPRRQPEQASTNK